MMNKPDYTYEILDFHGRNVIKIIDLDLGNMSVTNGIEHVVETICRKHLIEPHQFMIIYKDSTGVWDGWDPVTEDYVSLFKYTWEEAIDRYINLQLATN